MALQMTVSSTYGVDFNTAYLRIFHVEVFTPPNDSNNSIAVDLEVYATAETRDAGKEPIDRLHLEGPFDESSSLSKADLYTWLKTQPGFENAIDA